MRTTIFLALIGVIAAGCGSASANHLLPLADVTIAGFTYLPTGPTGNAAGPTTIANMDIAAHTVTADDGSFDSGIINPGGSGAIVATSGVHQYHCNIHNFMHGVLVVA
jgi:plastocyanin